MYGQNLKTLVESMGHRQAAILLGDALREGELKSEDFSLRELAEAFLGHKWVSGLTPGGETGFAPIQSSAELMEAGDAIDVTAYSNITGQLMYSAILEGFTQEGFISDSLARRIPTKLSGEKIPGLGNLMTGSSATDTLDGVGDGMPFPTIGEIAEDYVETPSTTKRGLILGITKETIFFDRTGLMLERARQIGERLGLDKEKRLLNVVLGITNNFSWRGTSYNTYLTSGSWINSKTGVELVDWTDVEIAELMFTDMTDPDTGEPIIMGPDKTLLVMPAKHFTARRILGATEVEYGTRAAATPITRSPNPLPAGYSLIVNARMQARIVAGYSVAAADAAKYWYYGSFMKAFAYMENWPITVVQAPANGEAEFERDIIVRFKASERGAAAVMNPRYVLKLTG